jgi:hypothetical protein
MSLSKPPLVKGRMAVRSAVLTAAAAASPPAPRLAGTVTISGTPNSCRPCTCRGLARRRQPATQGAVLATAEKSCTVIIPGGLSGESMVAWIREAAEL